MTETAEQLLARVTREHDEMMAAMSGSERLWHWFGLSRSTFLTMPRVMMHAMPEDWQMKMALLCEEWDSTWNSQDMPSPMVMAHDGRRFTSWPNWLLNYRHPDYAEIERLRIMKETTHGER